MRWLAFEEKGPKRFVLSVEGSFGRGKEARLRRKRYLITMSDSHICILLHLERNVNVLCLFLREPQHPVLVKPLTRVF